VSQHPELRPPSSAAAAAGARRIMHRLSTGINLLNNPAALESTLATITAEQTPANQNPQIYRVKAKFHYTDSTGPDRTGPDQTKSAHFVGDRLNSTTRARPDPHGLFCGPGSPGF